MTYIPGTNITLPLNRFENFKKIVEENIFSIPIIQQKDNTSSPTRFLISSPKNVTHSIALSGESLKFPFDRYYLNLTFMIPLGHAITDIEPLFGKSIESGWIISPPYPTPHTISSFLAAKFLKQTFGNLSLPPCSIKKELIPPISRPLYEAFCGDSKNYTFVNFKVGFDRNYLLLYTLLIPLITVFYLLGAIFILKDKDIATKVTITIGIFAFLFTFTPIVKELKPLTDQPTIAESLVTLILIGTIVYTISSTVNNVIKSRWTDWFAFTLVCLAVGYFLLALVPPWWLVPIIIIGLGY